MGKKSLTYIFDKFSKSFPERNIWFDAIYKACKILLSRYKIYSIKACMGMKNTRINVVNPLGVRVKSWSKEYHWEIECICILFILFLFLSVFMIFYF